MKIDRGKIKKVPLEMPFKSKVLFSKLMSCRDDDELAVVLSDILVSWEYAGSALHQLYYWADVLDKFDTVLEECCIRNGPNQWSTLAVDLPSNAKKKKLVMDILSFLSLLAESTDGGWIFNSTEHLATLLWSVDTKFVSHVLFVMVIFSDRGSFFQSPDKWLILRNVLPLAKSWGGKESDVSLAQCIKDDDEPFSVLTTSLNFECSAVGKDDYYSLKQQDSFIRIRLDNAQLVGKQIGTIMTELIELHHVPTEYQFELFNKIRLIQCFGQHNTRLEYVRVRLYALAFVACSHSDTSAFYPGLVKELVDMLSASQLVKYDPTEVQTAVVNALSALMLYGGVSLQKEIIKATNMDSPIGPLSMLVRKTIHELTITSDKDPTDFHECLFYLIVDIAFSNTNQNVIIQSGLLDSLLQLVQWEGPSVKHLRIVRYAMNLIYKWAQVDPISMRTSDGLNIIAKRLELDVDNCRLLLPDGISDQLFKPYHSLSRARLYTMQWAFYILKPFIRHPSFTDLLRRLMSGSSFLQVLQNILRHGRLYGASLFAEALEFVTVYIHQNPFNLSSLQDNEFSDLILNILLDINIPISRQVATAIPGVFGALCINSRGMESFLAMKPFERLFALFTSVSFVREIRKQRKESAEEIAIRFGSTIAMLVRQHSNLRPFVVKALIGLLKEICRLGTEPKYICSAKFELTGDEPDDYEDHQTATQPWNVANKEVMMTAMTTLYGEYRVNLTERRIRIPLHEYIKNSAMFIHIFLQSDSAETSKEFLRAGGLDSLLKLLSLPNLVSPTKHLLDYVLSIFETLQQLTLDDSMLSACLDKFNCNLGHINSSMNQMNCSTGSAILDDLCLCINSDKEFHLALFLVTPIVQDLSVLNSYLRVLCHTNIFNRNEDRVDTLLKTIYTRQWTSQLGRNVIDRLSKCYKNLLWEKLILNKFLAELTVEPLPSNNQLITKAQIVSDALLSQPPSFKATVRQHTQKIIDLIDQIDSFFKNMFSFLVQLSLSQVPDSINSSAVISSSLMKLIKDAFWWQTSMNDVDMRSKFCVSFIKISLSLFDQNKRNLYHCEKSVQEAFFELPGQMIGDVDSYSKSGRKLSNDVMDLLDSWLELLELQTNDFNVDHINLTFPLAGIIDPTEYIILTLKNVLNYLPKLWNVEMLRQFRTQTISRFFNVIANLFKSYGHVVKMAQEIEDKRMFMQKRTFGRQLQEEEGREYSSSFPQFLETMKLNDEMTKAKNFSQTVKTTSMNLTSKSSKSTTPKTAAVRGLQLELDLLAINIQNDVLCILEDKPSMVCELARLLFTVAEHNGISFGIGGFIRGLMHKVTRNATSIVNLAQEVVSKDDKEKIKLWVSNLETIKLANQVHLLAVLSSEMSFACAKEILSDKKGHFMSQLYTLLELTVQLVSRAGDSITSMPQLVCSLILLIDQNEKNLIAFNRRQQVMQQCSKRTWKMCTYESETRFFGLINDQLDKVYQNGHPYYFYTYQSCPYMVHFGSMNLYCERRGRCDPIFIEMDLKQSNSQASPQLTNQSIENQSCAKSTIETMVALLKLPLIDASTVEAIIRTCLRLTRDHSNACHFAQLGGFTVLLNLTPSLQFEGIVPMVTLLIRHVYENEHVLRCSMNNEISSFYQQSDYQKYPTSLILQVLHSIACRDQSLTTQWIKSLVNSEGKICFCSRCVAPRQLKPEEQCEQSKELTREILNILADRCATEQDTARPKREFVFNTTKLLAILAELSCFCKPNEEVVLGHKYKQGHTEQITNDCNALDFILDNMLHSSNSKDDSNFVIKLLIKLMSTSEPTFRKVFGQIDAALSRALTSADSADKHRKIESICSLIEQTIEDLIKLAPSLSSELFKMIEQCRFISTLAAATDKLDLSSAYISMSVNASLKTIDCLIDFVNKMKSTNSVMTNNATFSIPSDINGNSQQSAMALLVSNLITNSDLSLNMFTQHSITPTNESIQQRSSAQLLFRHTPQLTTRAIRRTNAIPEEDLLDDYSDDVVNRCIGSIVCPLMHPALLADKSPPASNPANVLLHHQNCRVSPTANDRDALRDYRIAGSGSRGNSVLIFHGCTCPMATQMAMCSMCQWFMECCLVDGQFQFDAIDLVQAELLAHRQKIIKENVTEKEKSNLSSSKVTSNASPNDPETKLDKTNVLSTAVPNAKSVVSVSDKSDTIKEDLSSTQKQTTQEQMKAEVTAKVTENISKGAISLESLQLALNTALPTKDNGQIDKVALDFSIKLDFSKGVKENQPKEPIPLEQSKDSLVKESPIANLNLTPEQRAILGDGPIPEGLDLAILVELPNDLRMEAIEQQRQINSHKQQHAQVAAVGANATGSNVAIVASPNIPAIGQGQQQPQPSPNDATNTAAQVTNFIQSLEPMVRRQVLSEMDDTQLQFLPEEMVTEVRALRQEAERLQQEVDNAANTDPQDNSPTPAAHNDDDDDSPPSSPPPTEKARKVVQLPMNGPQLVEIADLSSLLLLLFVKKDAIDRARFHSVMASFCSHQPTRKWMVYSLLDIMEKANPPANPSNQDLAVLNPAIYSTPGSTSWQSVTIESTFGAQLKVLSHDPVTKSLNILPQAANLVYDNVLDLFLVLTKAFPDFCLETDEPSSTEQQPATGNSSISPGQSAKSNTN